MLVTPAEAFGIGRTQPPHAVRICVGAARSRETLARGLDGVVGLLREGSASGRAVV